MDRRAVAAVALALLAVVAGCGGPATTGTASSDATETTTGATGTTGTTATQTDRTTPTGTEPTVTPSPTPTGAESVDAWSKVEVRGGNFSFDAAAVYRRVVEMHGRSLASAPDVTVYVRNTSSVPLRSIYTPSDFEKAMGITAAAGDTAIAGLARGSNVYIYRGVLPDAADREATLAHEYAHVLQTAAGERRTLARNVRGPATQRGRVTTGIVEGAATFVENRYRVRYLDQQAGRLDWNASRAGRTAFGAFLVAPYVFGHKYVHRRIDSVENLSAVYESPPQTTEQVIHGDGDEPRPLAVDVEAGLVDWRVVDRKTKGELFARLVLERHLPSGRAATAAAGWGNDRALTLSDGASGRSFAWVTRWDDPGEAEEFAAALRAYLDARGERVDGVWDAGRTSFRVVRAGDGTVVLLAGDGRVTIRLDGSASAALGAAATLGAGSTAGVTTAPVRP